MVRVYFKTYGCTLNQADTDIMKGIVRNSGHDIVDNRDDANVIIYNTCTVKGATENKIMEEMKEEKKPFVIAGCIYVNRERILNEIRNPVVVGPYALEKICIAIDAAANGKSLWLDRQEDKCGIMREITAPILRIPIQEGCVGNCAFCQTKIARPFLRSYPVKTIKLWIEDGLKKGAKEMQITGMDSGAYGLDNGSSLTGLLKEISGIEGDFKIRLGMINPQHVARFNGELIGLIGSDKFYKFVHAPVQTGSEKICREMNRPHTVGNFVESVEEFRKRIPDISIATDIIVGYAGETEEDFQETIALIEKVRPDVVNLSKFTVRRGTKAASLKQLPTEIIKERSRICSEVVKRVCEERNRRYVGKTVDVLALEKAEGTKGRTDNYKQVVVRADVELGKTIKVKITDANHGSLFGEIC